MRTPLLESLFLIKLRVWWLFPIFSKSIFNKVFLLVLEKPLLDRKLNKWATNTVNTENMNFMKLLYAIFMLYQNDFCYSFQVSEEGQSDNDGDFKMSWATSQ